MVRALIFAAICGGCVAGAFAASPVRVASVPAAVAPVAKPAPRWAQLSPQQQQVLVPLAAEWDGFPDTQRHKLLGVAEKYPKLTPQQQQRVQLRLQDWARLTPEQRHLARKNYKQLHELPPAQRQVLKDKIRQEADKRPLPVAPPVAVSPEPAPVVATEPAPVAPAVSTLGAGK